MNHKIKLSVLFLKEGDAWVGQCMEHDIAAQGKTIDEAKISLRHTIAAQMFLDVSHGKSPLSAIKPAPNFYKRKFDTAEKLRYTAEIRDHSFDAEVEDSRLAVI